MDKDTLLRSIRDGHDRWARALAPLSDDDLLAPAQGEWTKKDLVAHVEYWERSSVDNIEALRAGHERPEAAQPTDERNAQAVADNRDRSAADVRGGETEAFERLLATVEASDEGELVDAARYPVLGGDSIADMVASDTFEHYEEHLPHLTA